MCLAVPVQILTIDPTTEMAQVAFGEVRKNISLALLSDVVVGDYVLVHVGYAINRLSIEEAERSLALLRELSAQFN